MHESLTICSFPLHLKEKGMLGCFKSFTILFIMQAAQAVSKLCDILGEVVSSQHHVLLSSLLKEIPGRIWEVGFGTFYLFISLGKLVLFRLIHSIPVYMVAFPFWDVPRSYKMILLIVILFMHISQFFKESTSLNFFNF